jgi:membrane protease YdiL (CAAX protease family)
MLTRRLWLPIGIHAAWNFTQGWVFSVPVSGTAPPLGLLITRRIGPDWLTGGGFGLEASAVAMVLATLAGAVMAKVAIRRRGVVRPMWIRND